MGRAAGSVPAFCTQRSAILFWIFSVRSPFAPFRTMKQFTWSTSPSVKSCTHRGPLPPKQCDNIHAQRQQLSAGHAWWVSRLRAHMQITSAKVALPIQRLRPFSTHPPSTCTPHSGPSVFTARPQNCYGSVTEHSLQICNACKVLLTYLEIKPVCIASDLLMTYLEMKQ